MNRRNLLSLTVALAAVLLGGCATYTETQRETVQQRRAGNVASVAETAKKNLDQHKDDRHAVIYALEAGSAYRDLGLADLPPPSPPPVDPKAVSTTAAATAEPPTAPPSPFEISNRAFSLADDKIDDFEEKARHSIGAGITTALVNPEQTPYKGMAYDKIMTSTYKGLNYLALGDIERVRASFNKAYKRQADAVEENAKQIEMDKAKIDAAKKGELKDESGKTAKSDYDLEKSQSDPKAKLALDELNVSLDARDKAYGDFVNPFTVFSDALFMIAQASDDQEQERASKQFQRIATMAPQNEYLKDDVILAEKLAQKAIALPKITYVIFETGEAPHREEVKLQLPLILRDGKLIMITVPISKLQFNDIYNENLSITASGRTFSTSTISSMDSVIAADFKRALPSIYLNAFLSAATKAMLNYEIQKQAEGTGFASVLSIAANVYTMASSHADTRTWQSLPKSFAYARFDTPSDNTVTIAAGDRNKIIKLAPTSTVNLIYVRQVQPATELLTHAIVLK